MFKAYIAAIGLALAGSVAPAFADTTVHVFLWDAGDNMENVTGHKIGDNADHATDDMGVTASLQTVAAGKTTFLVQNTSTDTQHEMVVSRLSGPDAGLPYHADMSRVDEEAAGSMGEVSELEPGTSGALTVSLEPGVYALYCNVPGHYAGGMWTLLTVK